MIARLAPLLAVTMMLVTHRARAGGIDFPDPGARALGRGAAFAAKADDPTALYYNTAGLAQQKGVVLMLGANAIQDDFRFQRSGTYAGDPNDPRAPWAGQRFPAVENKSLFILPTVAFAARIVPRVTIGAGIVAGNIVGNRTLPLWIDPKRPSPARYDYASSESMFLPGVVAAGVHLFDWLDVGAGFHATYARLTFLQVGQADLSRQLCPTPEDPRCDVLSKADASGMAFGGSLGALARVGPLSFGASVRSPMVVHADGTVSPRPPAAAPLEVKESALRVRNELPLVARGGVRWAFLRRESFEVADVELDGTYESWGTAQRIGTSIAIDDIGLAKDIAINVDNYYRDTYGARLGGQYNVELGSASVLALRTGAFLDTSATEPARTRVNFDTLAKRGLTFGIGLKTRWGSIDAAYATVASEERSVTDGTLRSLNYIRGKPEGSDGRATPVVNNGRYGGHLHVVSVAVTIAFDEIIGGTPEAPPPRDSDRARASASSRRPR